MPSSCGILFIEQQLFKEFFSRAQSYVNIPAWLEARETVQVLSQMVDSPISSRMTSPPSPTAPACSTTWAGLRDDQKGNGLLLGWVTVPATFLDLSFK